MRDLAQLSSAKKVAIIEVKKFPINCNMTLETTTETAQALREAHVTLMTSDMTTSLLLLLTPSSLSLGLLWILGRAVRLYVLVCLMTKLFVNPGRTDARPMLY